MGTTATEETTPGSQRPPRAGPSVQRSGLAPSMTQPHPRAAAEGDDEDGDERMDVSFIQGFADKIQRIPQELLEGVETSRPKILIPKRGEKDFEPLQETVNLQAMMLDNSRQALFDALQGVRGVASKSLSHALVTPASPFPHLLVSRGHVLDSVGITVRRSDPTSSDTKNVARIELLPEEAIYMAERGTLQIWNGRDPETAAEKEEGVGLWCDEDFGIKGAVEMSVMEVFASFMGKEALTWQRYQTYASLKRLGYTVQRTRGFIPEHFLSSQDPPKPARLRLNFCQILSSVSAWLRKMVSLCAQFLRGSIGAVTNLGLRLAWGDPFEGTALQGWGKSDEYSPLFTKLRFIPSGHNHAVPPPIRSTADIPRSIYAPLLDNPYLPFFHVWKPVTAWSKAKWDRGSPEGLATQLPDYTVAVVESRDTPFPTLQQLAEVFNLLPDEPTGPVRRVGPQYERKPARQSAPAPPPCTTWASRMLPAWLSSAPEPARAPNFGRALNALRNGDRGLIVAVNDMGNTGWVRFGRSSFDAHPML